MFNDGGTIVVQSGATLVVDGDIDNDGVYEYSYIRTVLFESQGVEVEVYPNPTANMIRVDSEFPVTHVSVFNMYGKLVIDQDYLDAEIDLKPMNSGLYRVVITAEAGQFVKSVIKNRIKENISGINYVN